MDSSSYQQNNPPSDNNNNNNNNDPSRNNNNNDDDESRNNKQNDSSSTKKGKGRKKIPMQKIESDSNRQVTFSKRRVGVFKKASELHTLCGADNAVVVFSPSGKPYSFAAPNLQTITDQFIAQAALGVGRTRPFNQLVHNNPITRQRNAELTELERQLEDEKKKKKEHGRRRKVKENQIDYPPNIDLLDMNQLQALKDSLLSLKSALATTVNCGGPGPMDRTNILQQGPLPPPPPSPSSHNNSNMNHQFYYGNNGAMLNDDIGAFLPPGHDVFNNNIYDQTMFGYGVNNNNNASGGAPFLPLGMPVTNNHAGYFDQMMNNNSNVNSNADGGAAFLPPGTGTNNNGYFGQMMNNINNNNNNNNNAAYHQFPTCPNDHEAGGSSSLVFLNDEEDQEVLPNQEDGEGEDAGEARPDGGPNVGGYGSGFNNDYNNFGF